MFQSLFNQETFTAILWYYFSSFTRVIFISFSNSFTTWLAIINPATEGTNALEEGGIFAFRIGALSFPTTLRTSSRITMGLSSENTTLIPFLIPSLRSLVRITFAIGSVCVLLISAIWKRVGSFYLQRPCLK